MVPWVKPYSALKKQWELLRFREEPISPISSRKHRTVDWKAIIFPTIHKTICVTSLFHNKT